MRVCRCTSLLIWGGRLSNLLSLRSRYIRSVRFINSWLGMLSMLGIEQRDIRILVVPCGGISSLTYDLSPVVAEVKDQHVFGVLKLPWTLCQLVIAEILQEKPNPLNTQQLIFTQNQKYKEDHVHPTPERSSGRLTLMYKPCSDTHLKSHYCEPGLRPCLHLDCLHLWTYLSVSTYFSCSTITIGVSIFAHRNLFQSAQLNDIYCRCVNLLYYLE